MEFVPTNKISSSAVASTGIPEYTVSFDNRYMLTGFVNASLIPGTPFVNMWGNVTVASLLSTDTKGVITRISRELQSLNQDNISVAYDEVTLNSVLALLRICRWPNITPYMAFLDGASTLYPCTVVNLETNQWVSQPIEIADIDHTIFTTQYATWYVHQLEYSGLNVPENGDVWSGGLVLGSIGTTINLGEYLTHDVMFGNDDPFVPTYIEKLTVAFSIPGYQYLRASGYNTPYVRANVPYTLEWFSDSTDIISTKLYCRDLCCSGCEGVYYGSFAASGSLEVEGHPRGTQRLWLIKGLDSSGTVVSQMWFSAVATCPRKLTYFGEFIEDCKPEPLPPSPPPPPTPTPLPPPPSPSFSLSPSSYPSSSPTPSLSLLSPSLSFSPLISPSPLSPSTSPSLPSPSLLSPSTSPSLPSPSILSPSLLSPSPSPSLPSPSLLSPSPSPSPSTSPSLPSPSLLSPSTSQEPTSPEPVGHNDLYPRVSDAAYDGRFAITWANYDDNNTPIVMAQCFNANGNPTTAQFVVPSYSDKTSSFPDIAMAPDGTFVIVWTGPDIDYTADAVVRSGIQARMYNANGTPVGNQFRVNAISYSWFYDPAISMNQVDKSFIVVWTRQWLESKPGNTSNWYQDIECQRYDSTGAMIASNFEVNTPSSNANGSDWYCTIPSIGIADNGDFVIVWSYLTNGVDGATWCRRYKSTGVPYAVEFKTNTIDEQLSSGHASVDVAVAAAGAFTVTWSAYSSTISPNGYSTWIRCYDSSGVALALPFIANTIGRSYGQNVNRIACDRDGNFTVIWDNPYIPDDPIANISKYGIIARSFTAAGVATTDEYIVNNPNLAHRGIGDQYWPDVARNNSTGKWVAVWCGYQGVAPSGGIMGIWHSQVIGTPLPAVAFTITAPLSGSYARGTHITITWTASGLQPGITYKVNLGYTTSKTGYTANGWASFGLIPGVNGSLTFDWDTTPVAAGTYYMMGYIFNEDTSTTYYAHASTTFKIT